MALARQVRTCTGVKFHSVVMKYISSNLCFEFAGRTRLVSTMVDILSLSYQPFYLVYAQTSKYFSLLLINVAVQIDGRQLVKYFVRRTGPRALCRFASLHFCQSV